MAYTPIDKHIGKEVRVRMAGDDYVGLLAGIYTIQGAMILVITPMTGGGIEHHIPLASSIVTIKHER